ncbi:MAG: tetratricopeptide repeat protein, partial [Pseudolabrys sp.]
PMAHFNCGNILLSLKRYDEALAHFDRALVLRPDFPAAHSNRSNALQHLKRYGEALSGFDRALALKPDFADALYNRGNALMDLNRFDDALNSYDRALAANPNLAVALSNRGNALQKLDRLDDALVSYDRAIAVHPDYAEALCNRGTTLRRLNRYDEALANYAAAIAASPDHGEAHFGMAAVLLLRGDFDRGWKEYEWRWHAARLHNLKRTLPQPQWLGQDKIADKTILVYSEQGYGDTIQFCRYVPLLAERGARVILQVREQLKELLTGIAGTTQVLSTEIPDSALPAFDVECPLVSLPLAFKTQLETIPSAVPYLRVSPQRLADWDARLGPRRRPRIGLAWSGRTETLEESYRSIPLSALLPLFGFDATFVSLQKDVLPNDVAVLNKRSNLLHFADEIRDFADTAAMISHLDLVISIDTAVAHLAGALAKPVWVMLISDPDWRWLLDRADCPWYPTARLFRQDDTRTWDGVITRVQAALRDFVQRSARVLAVRFLAISRKNN